MQIDSLELKIMKEKGLGYLSDIEKVTDAGIHTHEDVEYIGLNIDYLDITIKQLLYSAKNRIDESEKDYFKEISGDITSIASGFNPLSDEYRSNVIATLQSSKLYHIVELSLAIVLAIKLNEVKQKIQAYWAANRKSPDLSFLADIKIRPQDLPRDIDSIEFHKPVTFSGGFVSSSSITADPWDSSQSDNSSLPTLLRIISAEKKSTSLEQEPSAVYEGPSSDVPPYSEEELAELRNLSPTQKIILLMQEISQDNTTFAAVKTIELGLQLKNYTQDAATHAVVDKIIDLNGTTFGRLSVAEKTARIDKIRAQINDLFDADPIVKQSLYLALQTQARLAFGLGKYETEINKRMLTLALNIEKIQTQMRKIEFDNTPKNQKTASKTLKSTIESIMDLNALLKQYLNFDLYVIDPELVQKTRELRHAALEVCMIFKDKIIAEGAVRRTVSAQSIVAEKVEDIEAKIRTRAKTQDMITKRRERFNTEPGHPRKGPPTIRRNRI